MDKLQELFGVKGLAIVAGVLAVLVVIAALVGISTKKTPEASTPTVTVTVSPEPSLSPSPTTLELYADCTEVWKVLGRPITKDDPGFPSETPNRFDLDSDGIGCEDNPTTPEDESQVDWQAIWSKTKGNAEEFSRWAQPQLKDFWNGFLEPTLDTGWNAIKDRF